MVFGFSAVASPKLTWETAKQQPSLTTRLSVEMLQRLTDRIVTSPDDSAGMLAFGLQNIGHKITVENILQKLKKMPEPVTVAALAARLQLYLALYGVQPRIQWLSAIKHGVRALEKVWHSYSHGQRVLAEDVAVTARALFAADQATASKSATDALAVLGFAEGHLMGPQGAWHHFDPQANKASMDGQLADNAALGLAFYDAYKTTGNRRWLDEARRLSELVFNRLYDRKLAGFFSRNSTSSRFYRPQELFVAEKPLRPNGMATLLLYRVGGETGEISYSEAAAKSIAALQNRALRAPATDIMDIVTTYQALLENNRNNVTAARSLQNTSFGIIMTLSFLAGMLGFLSPCTLPILPAYFAFASQSDRTNILLMTIAFFAGLALVFSLMGATATMLGALVSQHHEFLLRIGGIFIILFGLASLLGKGFSGASFQRRPALSLAGYFFFGMTFSVGWTACIGPILGVMLVLAATAKTAWLGAASLFMFALGLSLPLIVLSLYLGKLDRNGRFWRFLKGKGWEVRIAGYPLYFHTTGIISGLIFISLGTLMLTGYLTWLNHIFPVGIQAWFASIEDSLVTRFGD
jgi:cytochrome c-type biogenesis protein